MAHMVLIVLLEVYYGWVMSYKSTDLIF